MTASSWALLALYLATLLALVKPTGLWLAAVADGRLPGPLARAESAVLRALRVPTDEMDWKRYALGTLAVSAIGVLFVYALQRLQGFLPLNPQAFGAVSPDSSFNTAISFVTNTNWQGYGGESTMSYLTQMLALAVQNFLSAATGIAVAWALIRGLARHSSATIGNLWVDLTRATVWVLLPISFVFALFLAGRGVVQNFAPYGTVTMMEPVTFTVPKTDADGKPVVDAAGKPIEESKSEATQTLPMGPIASQEAIKMIGTNGGGFLNANSAHPYENPDALTNFLQMLAIFLIPGGLCYAFGRMVGDTRQGWAVLAAMAILFVVFAVSAMGLEQAGNPSFTPLGVDQAASAVQAGGNLCQRAVVLSHARRAPSARS